MHKLHLHLTNLSYALTTFFATLGALLAGFASHAHAQWGSEGYLTLHRGLLAHSIHAHGASGWKDTGPRMEQCSFSYPQGRHLKVYSGGNMRTGWNNKRQTGGEGIWIMSKQNGSIHVSAAGSEKTTDDVTSLPHDPSTYPEAYLGMVHDEDWALAYRRNNGNELSQVQGISLRNVQTNWWPARGEVAAARTPISATTPVLIWNFRYGRYNSGQWFADRITGGELPQMNAPTWAQSLSEDDFPEVVGISRARSKETDLQWTRKWCQWGHADYDDFLIVDNMVENASNSRAEEVYITFRIRFWQQATNSWRNETAWSEEPRDWSRDDHVRSTVATNYLEGVSRDAFLSGAGKPAGLQLGKDLADQGHAMLYHHDGESDHFTNAHLDVGDPYRYEVARDRYVRDQTWIPQNFIQQGQYFGLGVIDAMPPFNTYGGSDLDMYVSPHDNPSTKRNEQQQQPASATVWPFLSFNNFTDPDPFVNSPTEIFNSLTNAGYHDEPDAASAYVQLKTFRFINLPGRCQIDLYDVTGQRIWTFFNNDTNRGEVTWLQFTENRPSNFGEAMAPGIYFWKVTSLMPGSEGKIQKGTFVIIK